MNKKPNLLLFGIDSLRRDHMSAYGYHRLTTPHIDKLAEGGALFENHFSPSVPTTPGYASMLTGMDCFGSDVVALRHKGPLGSHVATLAEVLGDSGYNTTCIGFTGNPSSRGFHKYMNFEGWGPNETGRSPKAENLNTVAIPELKRLAQEDQPFFLFLRHMDPHSPYLPPRPYERMFYDGNERDPDNESLKGLYDFKPFRDYFASWFPEGCTDSDYIDAQYDGAIAYMDACIQNILTTVEALGIEEETLIVVTSDHGETLNEHDCYYDHHGLYETNLVVPLIFKYPGKVPAGKRVSDYSQIKDIMPTILDLLEIKTDIPFNGRSLQPLLEGRERAREPEFYITECTWMRKHGWRTPEWKLIHALEPDFHFKPEIELYNLIKDTQELRNVAEEEPEIVAMLESRMQAHIAKREAETGRTNPMYMNEDWHGKGGGPFQSSQQAYDALYIGSPKTAQSLQAKAGKEQVNK
ncbi:Multifunctional alkaline phosphatase superfamily protein [Paenibacillus solanacearum]|uniref:Multifunctional alkaline phosphatase superfamily protein n=1 Tax=Paenibacillus solanacearum TaxID=2048548 RepID=A0A916JSK2_9BACL|nr:sulfatase [Paenibacillus solanacearum]CAG7597924.1 Multifunctional alkaline phosphatase superfamily protein [Paenibacillus solanacearum]